MLTTDHLKLVDIKPERICEGHEVYLTEQYHQDFLLSLMEIPRYGWKVMEVTKGVATIQYQRRNLKLLMCLEVDTKYLKKEA